MFCYLYGVAIIYFNFFLKIPIIHFNLYIILSIYIARLIRNLILIIAAGRWFYPGPTVSSTNKTDHHDIAEILLKMTLNTIIKIYNKSIIKKTLIVIIYLLTIVYHYKDG